MVLTSINGLLNHAHISVCDRGVLFGESVYEVIPVYNNHPFQIDAHLKRLADNFMILCGLPLPQKTIIWLNEYLALLPHKNFQAVYIQITSGQMPIRDHIPLPHTQPNCIIHQTLSHPTQLSQYMNGFKAICVPDTRSNLASIKTVQLALNTRALALAHKRQYHDAIFVLDSQITEAASSNFFAVIDGTLITPPLGNIVNGLTRSLVLKLAQEQQIPYKIAPISLKDLTQASEVFLSSSIKILKPLIEIENIFYATKPGPIWQQLFHCYYAYVYHTHNITTYR